MTNFNGLNFVDWFWKHQVSIKYYGLGHNIDNEWEIHNHYGWLYIRWKDFLWDLENVQQVIFELDEKGQCLGSFKKFLESHGKYAQYSMPLKPRQNSVTETQNCTLMDMVRSILNYSSISLSLWMYAIKTIVYLLIRVSSKTITKTLYELWTRRNHIIRHLHVWGCQAEVKAYNPHEKMLNARTIMVFSLGILKIIRV